MLYSVLDKTKNGTTAKRIGRKLIGCRTDDETYRRFKAAAARDGGASEVLREFIRRYLRRKAA